MSNIESKNDPYAQMAKNTVDSKNQLKESQSVKFDNLDGGGVRIMLVGNSITLHGVNKKIGWHGEWGMAASAKEKDYVHRLESAVLKEHPDAEFCICQVASWERLYKDGAESIYHIFEPARAFCADIIVIRFIENCPRAEFDSEILQESLDKLIKHLDGAGGARVIVTGGFWRHPGDAALREYADKNGHPFVYLSDLGEDDAMKAIGLFEHSCVANHPGDLGTQVIADRIAEKLLPLINDIKNA